MAMNEGLCTKCANSIFCPTWAEYKCTVLKRRIYDYKTLEFCKEYKKRDKNFKESICQCKDCLDNELIIDEQEESEN